MVWHGVEDAFQFFTWEFLDIGIELLPVFWKGTGSMRQPALSQQDLIYLYDFYSPHQKGAGQLTVINS